MRITQSDMATRSAWSSISLREERFEARSWVTPQGAEPRGRSAPALELPSPARREHEAPGTYGPGDVHRCGCAEGEEVDLPADARMSLALHLLERLTGRRLRPLTEADLRPRTGAPALPAAAQAAPPTHSDRPAREWGMVITTETTTYEAQEACYSARGTVTADDGRTIAFALDLRMSRERLERTTSTERFGAAARAKDPLVISLDGRPVTLTDARTDIDLDADGVVDHVPIAAAGQAYLVQDLDADGVVDDGREIVGALSGDGFADLAAADTDGNGWIDAGDAIWAHLRLWSPGAGSDPGTLRTLDDAGIGALSTGALATPFTLEDAAGTDLGFVRATGVALTTDGQARAVSQIDVVA